MSLLFGGREIGNAGDDSRRKAKQARPVHRGQRKCIPGRAYSGTAENESRLIMSVHVTL